jgi:hypothetical protein
VECSQFRRQSFDLNELPKPAKLANLGDVNITFKPALPPWTLDREAVGQLDGVLDDLSPDGRDPSRPSAGSFRTSVSGALVRLRWLGRLGGGPGTHEAFL